MSLIFPSYINTVTTSTTVVGDSTITYVVLQLHGDGANNSNNNTFVDSSTNNFTITRAGTPTQGSINPFGSNWSNYFNGSTDWLTAPASANLNVFGGNFTIELWIYVLSLNGSGYTYVIMQDDGNSSSMNFLFRIDTSSYPYFSYYTSSSRASINTITSSVAISLNTWNHIAVTYNGTNVILWLNGVNVATSTTAPWAGASVQTAIGNWSSGAGVNTTTYSKLNAYISNLRFVKGTALYTSTFTPSTTPLTTVTNTVLLTCATNRFQDTSTVSNAITVNGSVSVQKFAPFSTSTSYSTSTTATVYSGSIYFNYLTPDYLSIPNSSFNVGASTDFTIEFWIYPTLVAVMELIGSYSGGSSGNWLLYASANLTPTLYHYPSIDGVAFNTALKLNAWNHIAVGRTGATTYGYVNGVLALTISSTAYALSGTGSPLYVGVSYPGRSYFNGYMSNIRLTTNRNLYTSAFTPSTTPLTAITGTNLLLLGTNGGIIDTTMQNNLVTVGDAKISTTQSKFGGSSMYFDGTGDWLTMPSTSLFGFGTSAFTIECWLYWIGGSGENNLVCVDITNGLNIFLNSSGWGIGTRGVAINNTFGTAPTKNVWHHIAVSRSGSTIYAFIDGVLVYSGANTTNYVVGPLAIAAIPTAAGNTMNGYIDDLRITNGVARYTTTFTPPTSANPDESTYTTSVSSTTYTTSFTTGSYVWVYNTATSRWWSTQEPTQTYTLTPSLIEDQGTTSTGYIDFPYGSIAQRPTSPTLGYMRFNTDLGYIEYYNTASIWIQIPNQNT